jgi:fructokinase
MMHMILCYGEVLWDALPGGLFLGGAPFNVACHLHELGEPVRFASRVGDDLLGDEIRRRMEHRGIDDALLQVDPELPTGFVRVALEQTTGPSFTILAPSSWDRIEATPELADAAAGARAIVFGSLVQRNSISAKTLRVLFETDTDLIFDVNLRPPFDDRSVVETSLWVANLVKLNDAELAQLACWFDLPQGDRAGATALSERFDCRTVCVTRGERGAALLHQGEWQEHAGYRVEVADAVGAGDAFLAALISGLYADATAGETLKHANAVGAYVASCNGATPRHDQRIIAKIRAQAT